MYLQYKYNEIFILIPLVWRWYWLFVILKLSWNDYHSLLEMGSLFGQISVGIY